MKFTRRKNPKLRRRGFSLPEVTISVGIVSVIILPTLALLASGGNLHQVATDRSVSVSIVETVMSDLESLRDSDSETFVVKTKENKNTISINPPTQNNSEVVWLVANQGGELLSTVTEAQFEQGISQPVEALYAIRITVNSKPLNNSSNAEIMEFEIEVQSPAIAPEINRDSTSFVTLQPNP